VNEDFASQLVEMGFARVVSEKALILTKNASLEAAVNWIDAHQDDPDFNEPLQLVGAGPAPKAMAVDPDLAPPPKDAPSLMDDMEEMDDELRELVRKLPAKGSSADPKSAGYKKPMSEMTHEEKMAWLEEKRALAKQKREARSAEQAKESEKSRQAIGKAVLDIQRQREEDLMKKAYAEKKKQEDESRRHRKEIQAKIAAEKERRKRDRERELAELEKQKAQHAAKAPK